MNCVVHHLNMKMKEYRLRYVTYNFVVHSNEMACIKRGRLGLDPVLCGVFLEGCPTLTIENPIRFTNPRINGVIV